MNSPIEHDSPGGLVVAPATVDTVLDAVAVLVERKVAQASGRPHGSIFAAARAVRSEVERLSRLSAAPVQEPVACVPVHPRNGPLWMDTFPADEDVSQRRSSSYPTMPLYTSPQPAPAGQVEPDLRGIDAGDVDEWIHLIRHGCVPRTEVLIRASDAVTVARRAALSAQTEEVEQPMARKPWEPFLADRADGVRGRYAIARMHPDGYRQVWNLRRHQWAAASDDVLTFEEASALLIAFAPTQPTKKGA